jgi:predicted ATPase
VRASGAFSISLRGLSREDVARLLESTTGQAPPPEVAVRIFDKSGGNPLYVQQLAATDWAERVKQAPAVATSLSTEMHHGLRESIARQLDGVSQPCQDLLAHAASLGTKFDFATLSAISGLANDALVAQLDEAQRARVVTKGNDGAYQFRHPLVRDVLYRAVPAGERAERHAKIASLLDAHWADATSAHAADLAYHYSKALPGGDARRALTLSMEAAAHATATGAHADAAVHYERALEALSHLRDEPKRLAVQLDLSRARERAGNAAGARAALTDAIMLARAFHDDAALADATRALEALRSS